MLRCSDSKELESGWSPLGFDLWVDVWGSRAKHLIGGRVIRGLDREAVNLRTNDCIEVSSSARWFRRGVIVAIYIWSGQRPAGPLPDVVHFWPEVRASWPEVNPCFPDISGRHVTCVTVIGLYTMSGLVRARGLARPVTSNLRI